MARSHGATRLQPRFIKDRFCNQRCVTYEAKVVAVSEVIIQKDHVENAVLHADKLDAVDNGQEQ